MANEIHDNTTEIRLEDGSLVTIKSLPIKQLRKFMKEWNDGIAPEVKEGEEPETLTDDKFMDIYVACNGIALSNILDSKDLVKKVDQYENPREYSGMKEEYLDFLEENVDVPNSEKILEICGGIQNDPKLMEAAMEALQKAEDGQN